MFVKFTSPFKLLRKSLGAHRFAFLEWVFYFQKSHDISIVFFEFNEVKNYITLSGNKTMVLHETSGSYWVIFFQDQSELIPQFISGLEIGLKFSCWSSCQESGSLRLWTTTDHFIVNIYFGKSLLKKR